MDSDEKDSVSESIQDGTEVLIETSVVSAGSASTEKMTYAPVHQVNRPTPSIYELTMEREM